MMSHLHRLKVPVIFGDISLPAVMGSIATLGWRVPHPVGGDNLARRSGSGSWTPEMIVHLLDLALTGGKDWRPNGAELLTINMNFSAEYIPFASQTSRVENQIETNLTAASRFLDSWWSNLVLPLKRGHFDVMVYANSAHWTDALLTRAARAAGISKVVMDLPNVRPSLLNVAGSNSFVDVAVAPSRFVADHPSVRPFFRRIEVINPGIDSISLFNPHKYSHREENGKGVTSATTLPSAMWADLTEAKCGDARPSFAVGFIGRLAPEKSPGLFLRAIAALVERKRAASPLSKVEIRAIIIGDGVLRHSMERLAAKLGISAHFLGWVAHNEIPVVLGKLDFVLQTSLSDSETFCIANVEVMAMGCPLISTGVGGTAEYLFGETPAALLIRDATPESVSETLEYALHHYPEMMRMAAQARTVSRRFSVVAQVEAYAKLYKTLVHTRDDGKIKKKKKLRIKRRKGGGKKRNS
jgi:glycosyltransferase involved in cell wall biosynthesis